MAKAATAAHEEAVRWARRLVSGTFYVLDTETTGMGSRDEVVQIAVLDGHGTLMLDTLVKPTIAIPPAVTRIHGMSSIHVEDAPAFPGVYDALAALLGGGHPVVVYNAPFDRRMIAQTSARWALDPPPMNTFECAMRAYARFHGARSGGRGNFRWWSLGAACAHLHITPVGALHRAENDCRMTLALVRAMAAAALPGDAPPAGESAGETR